MQDELFEEDRMRKIITIVGARPQFIKAAAVSRAFRNHGTGTIREMLVHTGQHYDDNMSQVFFDQLELPAPDHNLGIGSGPHGDQTGRMIMGLEKVLVKEKPDMVIIYGDTNSTLAGAIAAAKLRIPIAHVEAGLRSFNKSMPEEVNRILADQVSTLLFTPTKTAYDNLLGEGFKPDPAAPLSASNPAIIPCGDVMYDNALYFGQMAEKQDGIFGQIKVEKGNYMLCTIHRDQNTDHPQRLFGIMAGLDRISREYNIPVVLPMHPRTRKMLNQHPEKKRIDHIFGNVLMILSEPLPYLEMLFLEKHARLIMTDSGGVQKEAYFFRKPCIVLRKESEWKELLDLGKAMLTDAEEEKMLLAYRHLSGSMDFEFPPIFGDGNASVQIVKTIIDFVS